MCTPLSHIEGFAMKTKEIGSEVGAGHFGQGSKGKGCFQTHL